VGKPATPVVQPGDEVKKADLLARVDAKELGVNIHASIGGVVRQVTGKFIEIEAR
jgi:Na+-translocating ferredoxin:NAD+ oxidoreductase RnfC subunit